MLNLPISPSAFRERYFEREPALWRAALIERPMSLSDVDRALETIQPEDRTFQLFAQGLVPQHQYTQDAVELGQMRRQLDKSRFYSYLRAGATLVLNRFEDHSSPCRRLAAQIGRFSGVQVTSNAYLSFTGQGTFGKHWDTHDVFAIQLIGRKRWQVFAPTWPLPLSHQTSSSFPSQQVGALQMDFVMEAGDVLYLPRGWWHQAIPFEEPSFHLSVGTYAATVNDFLMWTFAQVLPLNPIARKAFPLNAGDAGAIGELFDRLRQAALDANATRLFQHELERRERHHGDVDLARHVTGRGGPLPPAALVRLTTNFPPSLEERQMLVNGARIQLDALGCQLIAVLRSCASMTLDALCERVSGVSREAVEQTVLSLSRQDVICVEL